MRLTQSDLITVDGIPAHPLVVHAVLVLLPLAAVGGLVIALRAAWRRRFGYVVLALTVVAVAAVPLATTTGEELQTALALPDNQLIQKHANLGDELLPFALAFGIAVLLLVVTGRLADRERAAALAGTSAAADTPEPAHEPEPAHAPEPADGVEPADRSEPADRVDAPATAGVSNLWRRTAIVAAALVAFTGVAATVQVVRIGHSGSAAVWQGVGGN